jgi:hypothetical protein
MLTIVDNCTRKCPAIEVDTSLGGLRVRRVLDRIASEHGGRKRLWWTNGPGFRGRALAPWSENAGCGWNSFSHASLCRMQRLVQAFVDLRRKLQRPATRRMLERELVHQSQRCAAQDRNLVAGVQRTTPTQFIGLLADCRACAHASGDASMRKAGTELLEQRIQAPSPAPDLIL